MKRRGGPGSWKMADSGLMYPTLPGNDEAPRKERLEARSPAGASRVVVSPNVTTTPPKRGRVALGAATARKNDPALVRRGAALAGGEKPAVPPRGPGGWGENAAIVGAGTNGARAAVAWGGLDQA